MLHEQARWAVPPLTTESLGASIHYRRGIAALVAGIAHADRLLARSLACDPGFALAAIGLGAARVVQGQLYVAASCIDGCSRGERQHAEVVHTSFLGEVSHARDLRREHRLEFPGDLLIVWLPVVVSLGRP